jgi:phospholipid N-methyltransferase
MSRVLAGYLHFFWAGVAKQNQTGALFPSQRFLIEKMLAPIPAGYCGQIVELGAGTGALTLRLAKKFPQARILACEINPTLAADSRFSLMQAGLTGRARIVSDSAEQLLAKMANNGIEKPDFILSGIPLGNFCCERTTALLDAIGRTMRKGGLYIQFQYSLLDRRRIKEKFSSLRTVPVFLNLPPAVVYYARK